MLNILSATKFMQIEYCCCFYLGLRNNVLELKEAKQNILSASKCKTVLIYIYVCIAVASTFESSWDLMSDRPPAYLGMTILDPFSIFSVQLFIFNIQSAGYGYYINRKIGRGSSTSESLELSIAISN